MNIPQWWGTERLYFRYNARGDWAGYVDKEGNGGTSWGTFGAWGDVNYGGGNYYTWNAQWGYMLFPTALNAVPGDALEGIYYAHGRWYVADTGLWLSPWDEGDYLYGGEGQDTLNVAQFPCPSWIPSWIRQILSCDQPLVPLAPGATPTLVEVLRATATSTPETPACIPTTAEPYCISSTDDEQAIVAHVLLQEGGTLYGYAAMRNIAQVIHNRVDSAAFPNTVLEVVSQGNGSQFNAYRAASARSGTRWLEANDVAEQLIRNNPLGASPGMDNPAVLYFHSCNVGQVNEDTNFVKGAENVGVGRNQWYYDHPPVRNCIIPPTPLPTP